MILDEIAEKTKERVAEQKKKVPLEEIKRQALDIVARETNNGRNPYSKFPFRDNLAADGIKVAEDVIDSGKAAETLDAFVRLTNA